MVPSASYSKVPDWDLMLPITNTNKPFYSSSPEFHPKHLVMHVAFAIIRINYVGFRVLHR